MELDSHDSVTAPHLPEGAVAANVPIADPRGWMRACLRADFARNPYVSQRITLVLLRASRACHRQRGPAAWLARRVVQAAKAIWVEGVIGSEIPNEVYIGPGVRIPHAARGVMIHPSVVIGSGCTIYHQTVFGVRDSRGGPVVGDDVEIGAGARILGPIRVGDRGRIGANAVVVNDTEPDGTYVGVPARRVVSRRER